MRTSVILTLVCLVILSGSSRVSLASDAARFIHEQSIYLDEEMNPLKKPTGIGCSSDGDTVFVVDSSNNRLVRYSFRNGIYSGGTSISLGEGRAPDVAQVASTGNVFVLDINFREILQFDAQGQPLGELIFKNVPGHLEITSFTMDEKGDFYLLDIFSGRVLIMDSTGAYLREIPFPEKFGFMTDLAVDLSGNIYLLDSVASMVLIAAKDTDKFVPFSENLDDYVSFASYITTDGRGGIYLVDQNGAGIIILSRNGEFMARRLAMGWKEGFLYYPGQMCFAGADAVLIADRGNNRVQKYTVKR